VTDDCEAEVWGNKDDRLWRIGGEAEVVWIQESTEVAVTSAIPPMFEAYTTLELPDSGDQISASPLEDPDHWTCIGRSRGLVDAFLAHPDLGHRAREVDPSLKDATPPDHTAI
jgi:hypothetical protein